MKVAITGGDGFVGRWLTRELEAHGHTVLVGRRADADVTDSVAIHGFMSRGAPDAVAHLAAVSFAPDARAEPARAFEVNVRGTINVLEAARALERKPAVLVTGSSEVYGSPNAGELPLTERSPLRPRNVYALSKAAQEGIALAYANRYGLSAVVTRSFNHTGPGQRPVFVVPAIAERVRRLRDGLEETIPVGNTTVRRDFTDVRDVARAYRLLLEAMADARIPAGGEVVNVSSGRSVAVQEIIEELCRLAGIAPLTTTDPSLVRPDDPPEIVGDASALRASTGWHPERDVRQILADVWDEASRTALSNVTPA
jgi:GDP-4-dehydro-6-deoxy-D-mannose reductase